MAGLRERGFDVERLRLAGGEDEGDLVIRQPSGVTVIEAKAGALLPAEFVGEAISEVRNFEKHRGHPARSATGIVIAKRRGKGVLDAYVLTTVREYFGLE